MAGIPGVTPQVVQSGANLLRQQGMLQGAQNQVPQGQQQFNEVKNRTAQNAGAPVQGLVGTENTQAALQPAIPKNLQQLQQRAVELNQESPGLYPDWQSALEGAALEDQQNIAQNEAQRGARQSQKGVESDIRNELRGLQSAANANIPDNVYQKIEDEALDAIEKGENELTAAKKARDKLDARARDYKAVDALGDATLILGGAKAVTGAINSLRQKFKANGELENFADYMVAHNGLSNEFAHSLAMPPPENISKIINDFPSLKGKAEVVPGAKGTIGFKGINPKEKAEKSQKLFEKIAPLLQKDDSPLAIGNSLSDKGYDSQGWRDYLLKNKDNLNLSQSQVRELEKVDKAGQGFLNDWFLKIFGGM